MKLPSDWIKQLDQIRDSGGASINLLLTKQCQYQCAHCMFRSGPKEPSLYMSYDVLLQIFEFARQLREIGLVVGYNMVGGEPTLNMSRFKFICDIMEQHVYEDQIEMTTNGWWLRHTDNIVKFVNAVGFLTLKDQLRSIRISDSTFHSTWRSDKAATRVKTLHKCSLEDCIFDWAWEDRDGGDVDPDAEDYDKRDSKVHRGIDSVRVATVSKRLFVDKQPTHGITPTGRANDYQMGTRSGSCNRHNDILFTFNPDGTLHDFCCNGGKVNAGHAKDGLALLWRRISYMDFIHKKVPVAANQNGERCRECEALGKKWRRASKADRDLSVQFGSPRRFEEALENESFSTN